MDSDHRVCSAFQWRCVRHGSVEARELYTKDFTYFRRGQEPVYFCSKDPRDNRLSKQEVPNGEQVCLESVMHFFEGWCVRQLKDKQGCLAVHEAKLVK